MMQHKKTLVIGASTNPERYAYKAIQSLTNHKHPVIAIGNKPETIMPHNIPIYTQLIYPIPNLHTISLYINPDIQKQYYDYIISLKPQRIIFNPGTENDELQQLAEKNNIFTLHACTLVLLSTAQY